MRVLLLRSSEGE